MTDQATKAPDLTCIEPLPPGDPRVRFMLCNPSRLKRRPPKKLYRKAADIQADAAELANLQPGDRFILFQAVAIARVPKASITPE